MPAASESGLGLGASDVDAAVDEVDVAPEHVAELVGARAGERVDGFDVDRADGPVGEYGSRWVSAHSW
jgi:hypothetical protein